MTTIEVAHAVGNMSCKQSVFKKNSQLVVTHHNVVYHLEWMVGRPQPRKYMSDQQTARKVHTMNEMLAGYKSHPSAHGNCARALGMS